MELVFKCGRKEINKIYDMSDGSTIEKNKQGRQIETGMRDAVLNSKIRENFTEKVVFEQRTHGSEGKSHTSSQHWLLLFLICVK